MGGIGKTALRKKVYHLFHEKYDRFNFLEDVKSTQIKYVQKQLLQNLCAKKSTKD